MSWFLKILGELSGVAADVDANNQLLVRTATDPAKTGFSALSGLTPAGATGVARGKPVYVSENGRVSVGQSQILWNDEFNAAAQNTSMYRAPATTMTLAQAGGFAVLNNSGITTANTNCAYQTYRSFPLQLNHELRATFSAMFASATAHVANCTVEVGLLTAALPGGAVPTDGAFFRWNAAGELRGVISSNGVETQTAAIAKPTNDAAHDYTLAVSGGVVVFSIDGEVRGSVTLATDAPALGAPFWAGSQPFTARLYVGAAAPASATKVQLANVTVSTLGPDEGRPWEAAMAGAGLMGYQGTNGNAQGSTAKYANSANATAAVPTNTTAALGTGLGGEFWETFSLAVNTDGVIQSFQNPVGSNLITPRSLVIHGVTIDSYVQTVLAGGPAVGVWTLNFGHTAVSLATAEAATTKAPRRILLGHQPIGANQAVSTALQRVAMMFRAPVVVAPGEFVACARKTVGTVGTSGVLAHMIAFDCYWE